MTTAALSKFSRAKTIHPSLVAEQPAQQVEQQQKAKLTRLNFEVTEFRKKQIKTYVSLKNISIKEFFDNFLNEVFGPENQIAQVEKNLDLIKDLTEEEMAIFEDADQFFEKNKQYAKKLGVEQSLKIAEQVKKGKDLAALLGYENVK